MKKYFLPYGWFGLVVMMVSEFLLFQENVFVGTWFTPIMWSGYILFMDNIVYGRTGRSIITVSRSRFPVILVLSICSWLIFEGYNVLIENWYYIGLPVNVWVRYTGYACSFATITPGILITADFLKSFNLFGSAQLKHLNITKRFIVNILIISAVLSLYPLLLPNKFLFPLVWCSYIFLIDAVNYLAGGRSLFRDLSKGKPERIYRLLLAGLICGFFWEFWNYWASAKWVYTIPYFPEYKLFEMPVIGYLGFPTFALECYVIYQLFKVISDKIGFSLRYE